MCTSREEGKSHPQSNFSKNIHLITLWLSFSWFKTRDKVVSFIRERIISPTDKVVSFQTTLDQTTKPKKDYSLGFVFPGNCVEIHKEIKKIFEEEMEKSCKASTTFKACFENCAIGALFRNEKKLGAIISKRNFNKSSSSFQFTGG